MSARGAGRNAGRNRGRVGTDGLRARERELLHLASAGEPLTPEQGVLLIERIARLRHGIARARERAIAETPGAALVEAYGELCSAFVLLLVERDLVDERLVGERDEAQRRIAAVRRRARADEQRLLAELARVCRQRDEFRDAARSADGQRIALQRVLELTEARCG